MNFKVKIGLLLIGLWSISNSIFAININVLDEAKVNGQIYVSSISSGSFNSNNKWSGGSKPQLISNSPITVISLDNATSFSLTYFRVNILDNYQGMIAQVPCSVSNLTNVTQNVTFKITGTADYVNNNLICTAIIG